MLNTFLAKSKEIKECKATSGNFFTAEAQRRGGMQVMNRSELGEWRQLVFFFFFALFY